MRKGMKDVRLASFKTCRHEVPPSRRFSVGTPKMCRGIGTPKMCRGRGSQSGKGIQDLTLQLFRPVAPGMLPY